LEGGVAVSDRDAHFTDYATARTPWLRKVAFLLCQDWHRADDLVQTTLTRLYVHWHRVTRVASIDGYARAILVNAFLAEQRTVWWKRVSLRHESIDAAVPDLDVAASVDLREALAALPPRQRAAIVLRYYCDLSVEETAAALGCAPGTVKSQTSRGLDAMRRALGPRPVNP
jgi:RNA polymerase sigma-70 factor (sigma-E family)